MNDLTFLGSNISVVKAHNLRAILLSLLDEGSLSRVGLAKKTGLSTTTVTNLIAELLTQGIVVEEGEEVSNGPRRVGRPRTALRLVNSARYAVGVHIGVGRYRVAVTDLNACIQSERSEPFDLETPAEKVLDSIAQTVSDTIQTSGINRDRLIGLGVGASGLVNFHTGVNVLAPNLGWRDVPIGEYMDARLGMPVVVDNNVRTMALGEAFFGAGKGVNSLAFVYGRVGLGAGFVVGGQVFRGSSAGAGEIGHSVLIANGGEACRCGNTGCLETLVSEPGLVAEALELAQRQPHSPLATELALSGNQLSIEQLFRLAREGNAPLRELISRRAYYLGMALANLVNILNPELIILGGMFAQGYDLMQPSVEETMRRMAFAGLGDKVRVRVTSFGHQAGTIGASALALTTFFYQQPEEI